MPTARQWVQDRIEAMRRLRENRPAETLRIAFDLNAAVQLRIQTRGQNFQERSFPPYTPGYAKRRAKAGFQVGYVDFTRTGRLWASVQPQLVQDTAEKTVVVTTARTPRDQDKLRGARRKRGNILQPSQKELDLANAANEERLLKYFSG